MRSTGQDEEGRRSQRGGALGWVLAILVAFASPSPAFADTWYQHYQRAEEALEEENWAEAIVQLEEALQRRGDSGYRVRTYGMRTTDYFPYLKLGIAYHGLGEVEAALRALETEERLEAVRSSDSTYAQLQVLRQELQQQQASVESARLRRIEQEVAAGLDEAGRLQDRGDPEGAIAALGPALALAPDHPQARALLDELQQEFRRLQREREESRRADEALAAGRRELAAGRLQEASRYLRQALDLRPGDAEIEEALDEVRRRLRDSLEARRAEDRERLVTERLAAAERQAAAGQTEEALRLLQEVLALDALHPDALTLQERLLDARHEAELEEAAAQEVAGLLVEGREHLDAGRFEEAVAAANRLLALDPGNAGGLDLVGRAYGAINRQLLAQGGRQNLPPAVRFADFRDLEEEGIRKQRVTTSDFRLSGVVIDTSPVEVALSDDSGRPLEATASSQLLGDLYVTEFQVHTVLEPGERTLRVVATDEQGLSSSSEYSVLYTRPLWRSPVFLSGVAVLGLALIAVPVARRVRQRAARRRRRFNPYIAGAPVLDEELFFGRQQLLDRVLQTIHNNSLLLHGERRIGKTTLQHHIKRRLEEVKDPRYQFFAVYIDLQGVPEERFFATLGEETVEGLGGALDGWSPEWGTTAPEGYSHRDLARDLRSILRRLQATTSKQVKLVLLIDEVDELNDFDPRVNQRLRSLFMKTFAENLVAVVSGVEIKRRWRRKASPWYNFFEEIEVEPLLAEEARDLIQRPIAGVIKVDREVAERITSVTGGRPYAIQRLCVALVNRAYERGRRRITEEDFDAVASTIEL